MTSESQKKFIAKNKKAWFDYEIQDKIEAGIALKGSEVKSIRAGKISLAESFAKIDNGEIWLYGCHINPYSFSHHDKQDPLRTRKLLLHKQEIKRLTGKIEEKGMTLVPLSVYFSGNKVKIELGVAKAKKKYDKRQSMKEKETRREAERAIKSR